MLLGIFLLLVVLFLGGAAGPLFLTLMQNKKTKLHKFKLNQCKVKQGKASYSKVVVAFGFLPWDGCCFPPLHCGWCCVFLCPFFYGAAFFCAVVPSPPPCGGAAWPPPQIDGAVFLPLLGVVLHCPSPVWVVLRFPLPF